MPIKKSYLEQKRYYRTGKVFFLLLPILIVLILYILQKNLIVYIGNIILYAAIGLPLYYLILKVTWNIFLYIAFGGLEDDTKKKKVAATQPVAPALQPVSVPAPVQPAPASVQTPTKHSDSWEWFILLAIIIFAAYGLSHGGWIEQSHTYGASCTNSDGTGLYGTDGDCYTCSAGATAFTSPINNNCSSGESGIYCCWTDGKKGSTCTPTGCPFSAPYYGCGKCWESFNLCHTRGTDSYTDDCSVCRKCP